MNPEDTFTIAEQLEFDLDTKQTHTFTIDTTANSMPTYSDLNVTFDADTYGRTIDYEDPVEKRLQKIENALAIIQPNLQLEEKYPHIKELRENYEKEVEAVMTFEYLEPKKTG